VRSGAERKICHIITRLDLGGSAENTLLTAIGLQSRGYRVDVVCGNSENPASPNEERAAACGVRIIRIAELVRPISPIRDLRALIRLLFLLRRNHYDLLHTHTSKAGIVGRIAGYLARVPVVVHTPHGHIFYGYFSTLMTGVFTRLERIVTRGTHALITLTNKEKEDYLKRTIGTAGRIYPILSGIDLSAYQSIAGQRDQIRISLGLSSAHFVVGTVARLVPVKNHALIIDAAALLKERAPEVRFVFVGDGELRTPLEQRAARAGVSSAIMFLGWRNDIAACLAAFDLFVMCSHNEGMGRAFIEAQACGVPVVGSRVGGVEEALCEGVTGFLVDPEKPAELAGVIERCLRDRALLERMSVACRRFVNPTFSCETMVNAIDRLYRTLFDERQTR